MKKILFVVMLCLIAASVNAAEIGIVVDFPDGKVIKNCVEVDEDTNGYDLLNSAYLDILWSNPGTFGHALCKIEGIGHEVSGTGCGGDWGAPNYWGYYIGDNSQWNYMMVGWDAVGGCDVHYCATNGDVLGFRYGEFGTLPEFFTFNEVCNFGITKVKVDPKKPKPGEEVKVDVSLENNFDFDLEDIELKVWFEKNSKKLEDDDNDDIEDDSNFDLDSEDDEDDLDDEDHIFTFEMPFDVDDNDEYNVYVTLEGKQANDSSIIYRALDFSKTIKFEREKHEIEIFKFLVDPGYNRNVNFEVGLRNLGEKDEDVTLRLFSPELGIDKTETFELENDADDNEYKNSYNLKFSEDFDAGDYLITLKVEYNDGEDYVTKTTTLSIQKAEMRVDIETNLQEDAVLETPEIISEKESVETTETEQFKVSNNIIIIAALGLFIIIVFGGLLVAKLIK